MVVFLVGFETSGRMVSDDLENTARGLFVGDVTTGAMVVFVVASFLFGGGDDIAFATVAAYKFKMVSSPLIFINRRFCCCLGVRDGDAGVGMVDIVL